MNASPDILAPKVSASFPLAIQAGLMSDFRQVSSSYSLPLGGIFTSMIYSMVPIQ